VHVKIGLISRPIVSNRLYGFENTKTWHEVFVEVYDDDFFLRKTDEICMTVSDLLITSQWDAIVPLILRIEFYCHFFGQHFISSSIPSSNVDFKQTMS
jgi:hypothetical protein